ncbi:major facilitator superfamily transporter [Tritrichomonas foetus]|uniref:Major facilitator superfamily transporter n=1 Tax=Tritrichomonas foetus TaxID=1144522 RepID=A0A1J4KZP9_9EUKA|nr:major facilitator superfamily transporter [Tritrichomonas foetus]|eukprot:OHT16723.1 major facilitator superfamily transporter [Tritrichomonas foetus]
MDDSNQAEIIHDEENAYDEGKKWIPLSKRDHIKFIHLMGITIGTLASTLLYNILYTLFTPLCVKLKLPQIARTMLLFSGGLIGFVIGPLAGTLSDTTTFRFGRRRIFMIVGGIFIVLFLLTLMYCVEIGEYLNKKNPLVLQQTVMILSFIFVIIAGNFVQIPSRALCSDVTPKKQQVLVSSCVTVYSGVGGIFSNLVGALQLYKYTNLSQESFVLVVGLSICAVSLIIPICVTREEPLLEKPAKINPFKNIIQAFKSMPIEMWRIGITCGLTNIATYQIGVQQTDFMGRTIEHGDNAIDAGFELNDKYQKGVSWAMLCNVMNYSVQFLYSFVNTHICKLFGMKWVYIFMMFLVGIMYFLFFFVRNKIAYMFINIPVGLATVTYISIPQAITALCVPQELLGVYMGVLPCFTNIGAQISNFGIGMGGAAIYPNRPELLIGISSIFAIIAAISGFWIIIPSEKENSKELKTLDDNIESMKEELINNDSPSIPNDSQN